MSVRGPSSWKPLVLALAAVSSAAAACYSAAEDDPVRPADTAGGSCDVARVFADGRCTTCHTGASPAADLDLSLPSIELGARVLDAPSKTSVCSGRRLVDSRDPEASVLLSAVDHVRRGKEGACALAMPPGAATGSLPAADVACLEQFVKDLAATAPPAEPFEPMPLYAALAKVKLLVHGGAVTQEELATATADPNAIRGLVDGWTQTPEFEAKMRSFLGTALQQDATGKMREGLGFPRSGFQVSPLLRETLASSFVETGLDLVRTGRPFTEVVTTRRRSVTTAELVLLAYAEQTTAEAEAATFKVKLVLPAKENGVPATLTKVSDVWEVSGAASLEPDGSITYCQMARGRPPVTDYQEIAADRFLALLFGRIQCRNATPDLRFTAPVTTADHQDRRFVAISQGQNGTPFYELAALRAVSDGATLTMRAPRVGFMASPVFLDNWQTNEDNQYRVTLNQTLNVALGSTFSMGDPTPNAAAGIDQAHAAPGTPCYDCHRLMDPMRPFFSNRFDVAYRAKGGAATPATFAFFGSTKTGSTLDDFAEAIAQHPRFATAWVQKLCSWANSRACSEAEPGVAALAASFRTSNHDFRKLVVDTMSSPLVTGLSGTPLSVRPELSIARRRHFCAALSARLGKDVLERTRVCEDLPAALGKLLTDDAFARGNPDFIQTASPGTFHAAGIERICLELAANARVKALYPNGSETENSASVAKLAGTLMGLPENHPRRAKVEAALASHVKAVVATGATAEEAMMSAFVVACESPDLTGVGL